MSSTECEAAKYIQPTGRRRFFLQGGAALAATFLGRRETLAEEDSILLMNPKDALEEGWNEKAFGSRTIYSKARIGANVLVRATSRGGASGLFHETQYDCLKYPWLEWTWQADRVHQLADIRSKEREDYTASILFLFGKPSPFRPKVDTLGYVWTSERTTTGDIISSPLHPELHKSIVLQSGTARSGEEVVERRNIVRDYELVFKQRLRGNVAVIALWTDSDQTREEVEAYYGPIWARRA